MLMLLFVSQIEKGNAQDSINGKPSPILTFFGNGDMQKSLDEGEKLPANTGLGVSYRQLYAPGVGKGLLWKFVDRLELEATINVASNVDTIIAAYDSTFVTNNSEFGSSILTPLNSGQAIKIGLRLNFDRSRLVRLIDGVKAKYVGSNRNWMAMEGTTPKVIKATNNCLRVGLFHEFIPKNLLDDYSINLAVNLAYNSVKGDVGLEQNGALRQSLMGSSAKKFLGPEVSLEIRLRNLKAEFAYSWLQSKTEVPGLTGGRMVTTISFIGGFGLGLR